MRTSTTNRAMLAHDRSAASQSVPVIPRAELDALYYKKQEYRATGSDSPETASPRTCGFTIA
jgi:hypothetical protein